MPKPKRNSRWGGTAPRYSQEEMSIIASKYYVASTHWFRGARVTQKPNLDARRAAMRRYYANNAAILTPSQRAAGDHVILECLKPA